LEQFYLKKCSMVSADQIANTLCNFILFGSRTKLSNNLKEMKIQQKLTNIYVGL